MPRRGRSHPAALAGGALEPTGPLLALLLLVCGVVLLRTAWLCDDAFITFRTIDNWSRGYGLTWNVPDRVQVYTHPLWMLVVLVAHAVTREFVFTVQLLSVGLSLLSVGLLVRSAPSRRGAAVAVVALLVSRAFVDYSTSGLENPLTHVLLALFFTRCLDERPRPRRLLELSALAGLCVLNRMDLLLLVLPALAHEARALGDRRQAARSLALGFAPFAAWEAFALFYYGSPLPNTSYSKLGAGVPLGELLEQGAYYFVRTLDRDPVTLLVLAAGAAVPWAIRSERRAWPASVGVGLYLLYVLRIGGDFMAGRFFAAPLFVGALLLARVPSALLGDQWWIPCALLALLGGAASHPTLTSDSSYGAGPEEIGKGITDERGFYYPGTGLLTAHRGAPMPTHRFADEGRAAARTGEQAPTYAVGMIGFYAGPRVRVVDQIGLTDPLLARLPFARMNLPAFDRGWRIGHPVRALPEGYVDTVRSQENRIVDPNLREYYRHLVTVLRGDLLSAHRLAEIWRLNTGRYDPLLRAYVAARAGAAGR